MNKRLLYFSIFVLISFQCINAQNIWTKVAKSPINLETWDRTSLPKSYHVYELDINSLRAKLVAAPNRKNSNNVKGILVELPFNDKLNTFEVYNAPVLDASLQEQLTNVNSYVGRLVSNKDILIRFSLSLKGFNAIILNGSDGTQYIDSYTKDNKYSLSYFKKDLPVEEGIECLTSFEQQIDANFSSQLAQEANRNADDGMLREFRLALACTQEYAGYHIFQLGLSSATDEVKKDAILNIMNDIMTRVNAVYENELSVTMTLVDTNRNVIFLEDSFLSNNDIESLINQSQTYIDIYIGANNYDIGHMLSTSGSGLAQLFSPCTDNKARAVSGGLSSIPQGVVFENVIMHEMGHQYGAFHTYNSTNCAGPSSPNSAYEPGSGTTIMSYAGICGSTSNIQPVADTYFHQNSLDEIWFNLISGNSTCAEQSATNNSAPISDAGNDFTIPIATPYKLIGNGSDIDGLGSLTYTWEQLDLGPSVAVPNNFTENGPIVRSFPPSTNNTRYIPRLQDYVNNVNSSTSWEKLVFVNRDINFSLTVRDNDISGGQTAVDYMVVTVDASGGQFDVTSQDENGISYNGSTTQTVTWNVANTDAAPFGVNNVNILLSTDGGLTFDTVLLANTINDGVEDVILPNVDSDSCRIMVEAVGNIFYNINSTNFAIQENLSVDENDLSNFISVYPNPSRTVLNIEFNNSIVNNNFDVKIFDLRGRQIIQESSKNIDGENVRSINVSSFEASVYILQIRTGNKVFNKRIVIK